MDNIQKLCAIRKTLGFEAFIKNDEVIFRCPKCNHHKPKLSVNINNDYFHCWVCSYSGRTLIPLMLNGSDEKQAYINSLNKQKVADDCVDKKYDVPCLPAEFRTLSKKWRGPYYKAAISYLHGRKIMLDKILKFKLGYCEDGEMKNRIIIPSFDEDGNINFVVGRSFYERSKFKYFHGNYNKDIIFNDYLVDWRRPIILTEGPFDAFVANDNAIPLQTNILNINSKLFNKIISSGVDVFFALDSDAIKNQIDMIETFVSYGIKCHYISLGSNKDVGELTTSEFLKLKKRSVSIRSTLELLKLKLESK